MWAYFDTSALVKRYVDESGRAEVLRLLRRHQCVVSVILPVELRSALRRRVAEGALDVSDVTAILERVKDDRAYWTFVEIGHEVLMMAETLVAQQALRTLDAIHIASAYFLAARVSMRELRFVSADKKQIDGAAAIGLATARIV